PLPWYAEEKLRQGAYAALLGVTFSARPGNSLRWSALAVGDCCLFQVRNETLVACFPIEAAAAFNSRPYLIGSVRLQSDMQVTAARRFGSAEPGDRFLLASDAIAAWFLTRAEEGGRPWREIEEAGEAGFASWVRRQRESGAMRNDDVTLLTVTIAA
ncbi:MAG TPA: hypothetical protein VK898_00820, partial [Chloroflexota bacterium]|nr:hypothetical protein [Chloroflexota bacterium]